MNHKHTTAIQILTFLLFITSCHSKEEEIKKICQNVEPIITKNSKGAEKVEKQKKLYNSMTKVDKLKTNNATLFMGIYEGSCIVLKVMSRNENNEHEIRNFWILQEKRVGIPEFIKCEIGVDSYYLYQECMLSDVNEENITIKVQGKSFLERMKLITTPIESLVHAHSKKIIHNDIKLENLMFKDDQIERIFIIDWGFSREFGTKLLSGSRAYLSPEKVNHRNLDIHPSYIATQKDDVWALGISMIEIFKGSQIEITEKYLNCFQQYYSKDCVGIVLDSLNDYIKINIDSFTNQCGLPAIEEFKSSIAKALAYEAKDRFDSNDFLAAMKLSIKKCEDHANPKRSLINVLWGWLPFTSKNENKLII
jgi:serine/threonine protein kinase